MWLKQTITLILHIKLVNHAVPFSIWKFSNATTFNLVRDAFLHKLLHAFIEKYLDSVYLVFVFQHAKKLTVLRFLFTFFKYCYVFIFFKKRLKMSTLIANKVKTNMCFSFNWTLLIVPTILCATVQIYTTYTTIIITITIHSLSLYVYNLFSSHTCSLFFSQPFCTLAFGNALITFRILKTNASFVTFCG